MQNSHRNSIETALQRQAIEASIQKRIDETHSPIQQETERLRQENLQLRNELEAKQSKYCTIRQQLQLLTF
jgi:prefoldin subunit 5